MLASRHIQAISALEQQALQRRSSAEKISDLIVAQAGRVWAIILHLAWFALWILWNSHRIPGLRPFDPFPFMGLSTIVSLEAIFLSLFILVSQNRASRRADERAHLDLQVNLLSEREATKMLQLLQALCTHQGVSAADDPEVTELLRETEPAIIARELEQQLPSE
jgi:uncharacterized membrane protein